jgi:hypothetical protein
MVMSISAHCKTLSVYPDMQEKRRKDIREKQPSDGSEEGVHHPTYVKDKLYTPKVCEQQSLFLMC